MGKTYLEAVGNNLGLEGADLAPAACEGLVGRVEAEVLDAEGEKCQYRQGRAGKR